MKNVKRDHDQAFQQKVNVKVVMVMKKQIMMMLNIPQLRYTHSSSFHKDRKKSESEWKLNSYTLEASVCFDDYSRD